MIESEEVRIRGETAEMWAKVYFECGPCPKCGKGIEDHDIIDIGHWFAVCKPLEVE